MAKLKIHGYHAVWLQLHRDMAKYVSKRPQQAKDKSRSEAAKTLHYSNISCPPLTVPPLANWFGMASGIQRSRVRVRVLQNSLPQSSLVPSCQRKYLKEQVDEQDRAGYLEVTTDLLNKTTAQNKVWLVTHQVRPGTTRAPRNGWQIMHQLRGKGQTALHNKRQLSDRLHCPRCLKSLLKGHS